MLRQEGEMSHDWMDQAACLGADPEIFHPQAWSRAEPAKRICRACPVKAECLDEALRTDSRFGVRGGLTERERAKLRKRTA